MLDHIIIGGDTFYSIFAKEGGNYYGKQHFTMEEGNQLHPDRGVEMKRGRAGEWFENEEVAGFLRADGSLFVCFVKNAMETVAGGFQFDLPEVDGYEEDFLLR